MLAASLVDRQAKTVVMNYFNLCPAVSVSIVCAGLLEFDELKKKYAEECENVS